MSKEKIATFRVPRERWDIFVERASANGLTAAEILREAIDDYLEGRTHFPSLDNPQALSERVLDLEEKLEEVAERLKKSNRESVVTYLPR